VLCVTIVSLLFGVSWAQTDRGHAAGHDYDADNAAEIMELCAGCHGEFGQGGGGGEYPRLAGLPAKYLADQLHAYQNGDRESIAMVPYVNERELPETDLLDITLFLSRIELPSKMPKLDPDLPAYQKLLIAQRVFNVPRLAGDTASGRTIYDRQCKLCHAKAGAGKGAIPQLAGQYTAYLRTQLDNFRSRTRTHKRMLEKLKSLSAEDVENLLAYLSVADD